MTHSAGLLILLRPVCPAKAGILLRDDVVETHRSAKDHGSLRGMRDEGSKGEVVRAGRQMGWGGVRVDAWVQNHPAD